jgi:hypothetical protein
MKKSLLALSAAALVLVGAGCSFDDVPQLPGGGDDEYGSVIFPEGVEAAVEAPLTVSVGDEFEIVATLTNNSGEAQILHSIDIGLDYLSGIAITGSNPQFTDQIDLPDDTKSHFLIVDLAEGESVDVSFSATALTAGDYSGTFDVCMDQGYACSFLQVRTLVQ